MLVQREVKGADRKRPDEASPKPIVFLGWVDCEETGKGQGMDGVYRKIVKKHVSTGSPLAEPTPVRPRAESWD